jgi:hypothetical protein
MSVPAGLDLGNEGDPGGLIGHKLCVGSLIARPDHDTDIVDSCVQGLTDNEAEHGAFLPLLIHQHLHWQIALSGACRGNHRFPDLHCTLLSI